MTVARTEIISQNVSIQFSLISLAFSVLQAATVTASLEKSNRVKAVVVKVVAEQNLMATGNFPVLKVNLSS